MDYPINVTFVKLAYTKDDTIVTEGLAIVYVTYGLGGNLASGNFLQINTMQGRINRLKNNISSSKHNVLKGDARELHDI